MSQYDIYKMASLLLCTHSPINWLLFRWKERSYNNSLNTTNILISQKQPKRKDPLLFPSMSRLYVLLFILMVVGSIGARNDSGSGFKRKKSDHKMAMVWALNPIFGLIGTFLNGFILYMFYTERQSFIKPINAMIW